MFDTSKFANLSKRDYTGSQIISSGIAQNTSEQKTEKREHRSSSDIDVFINPKEKLNSLISPEMQKELEDFRMNNASRTSTNRKDTGGDRWSDEYGVFAEAILGLSTAVKEKTQPIDKVLNPFQGQTTDAKLAKGKEDVGRPSKDLSKFLPGKVGAGPKKDTGFSLSRFF